MVAPAPKGAIQNCPLSEWPQEKVSGTDWFFQGALDTLTDNQPGEQVNNP